MKYQHKYNILKNIQCYLKSDTEPDRRIEKNDTLIFVT